MSNLNDLWDYDSFVRRKPKGAADDEQSEPVWPKRSGVKPTAAAEAFEQPALPPEPSSAVSSTPPEPSPATSSLPRPRSAAILKRGHAISYAGLFLFTLVLYFRPYELIPALAALDRLALWVAIATLVVFIPSQFILEGTLTTGVREVKLVGLLSLMALLSIPFAIQPSLAWDTFFNKEFIRAVLMFIVLVNVVRTERRLKALILLSIAVSCYLSFFALKDYATRLAGSTGEARIWGAIGGMFGNPNDLALHLVTVAPITIGLLLGSRSYLMKIVYALCALLFVAGIVVTFSRGAFLGLIVVSGVLAWKLGRRYKARTVILTGILLLVFVMFAPGNYGLRVRSILDSSLDTTGSASARSALLTLSFKVALRHPLFGVGMGNFNIMSVHEQVNHNSYMQVATELGFLALVFYVLFMVTPIRRLRRIERETFGSSGRERRFFYLAVGLQAGLIGYMVSSFFASVAYQFYVYYLVGYGLCFWRIYQQERELSHGRDLPPTQAKKSLEGFVRA